MKRKKVVALLLAAAMTSASFLPSVGTFNTEGPLANGVVAMANVSPANVASEGSFAFNLGNPGGKVPSLSAFFFNEKGSEDGLLDTSTYKTDGETIEVEVGQTITRGAIVTGDAITVSAQALATSLGAAVSLSAISSESAVKSPNLNVVEDASVTSGVVESSSALKNATNIVGTAAAISGSFKAVFPGKATVKFVSKGANAVSFGAFNVIVKVNVKDTTISGASLEQDESNPRKAVATVTSRSYVNKEGQYFLLDSPTEYVSGSAKVMYEWYYSADINSKASLATLGDSTKWTKLTSGTTSSTSMTSTGAYAVKIWEGSDGSRQTSGSAFVPDAIQFNKEDEDAKLVAVTGTSIQVKNNELYVVKPGYVRADDVVDTASASGLGYDWYVISSASLTAADKALLKSDDVKYSVTGKYGKFDGILTSSMKNLYFAVRIYDKEGYTGSTATEAWLTSGLLSYTKPNDTGKKSGSSSSTSGGTSGSTSGSTGSNSTTGNNNTTNTSTTTTDTTKPADNAPTSTTVENADGSKTTTTKETKADGTVVESVKTVYKDNSSLETITETRKDGTTIETTIETAANGDKATTTYTTNPNTKTRSKEVSIVRVDGTSETTTITESTEDGSATIVNATKDAAGETSIEYTLPANGSGLTVGKIETTAKKVVIPAKIAIAGGNATLKGVTSLRANTLSIEGKTIKVTKVGAAALKGNKTATKLTIGKNIKTIGKQAFMNASKVKTVNFKGNVNTIGKNSFKNINKKATIKIKATAKQFKALKKKIKNKGAAPAKVTYKRVK